MKIVFNNPQKLNEIVFANRNKSYGAYAIRAAYNSTIFKSLSIVSSTVFLFAIGVYIFTRVVDEDSTIYLGTNDSVTTVNIKPFEEKKQPDPPSQPQGGKKVTGVSNRISDTATVENHPELDPNVNQNPNGTGTGSLTGTGPGTVETTASTPTVPEIPEEPTAFPEEAPEFEGGIPALMAFIKRNTVYPDIAREINREGTVYATFIINEQGEVESTKILKGIGAGCDEEAARVVNKIPKFKKPGRNKYGKPVKTVFNVPFVFKLR